VSGHFPHDVPVELDEQISNASGSRSTSLVYAMSSRMILTRSRTVLKTDCAHLLSAAFAAGERLEQSGDKRLAELAQTGSIVYFLNKSLYDFGLTSLFIQSRLDQIFCCPR
jgi:hypothetical protein